MHHSILAEEFIFKAGGKGDTFGLFTFFYTIAYTHATVNSQGTYYTFIGFDDEEVLHGQ